MTVVRVVVVDDHAVFREGVRALLARVTDVEVVGEAATTDEAIAEVTAVGPDVVLMDLQIPGEGGIHAVAVIGGLPDPPAVLVLTMNGDDSSVRRALAAGARGYLLKDAQPDAIVRAILTVHDGQAVLGAGVADAVLRPDASVRASRPFPALTARELDVLRRMARGLTNEAIAVRLGLATKTVQNTVSTIFLKIGARDRAHAVSLARDAGVGAEGPRAGVDSWADDRG